MRPYIIRRLGHALRPRRRASHLKELTVAMVAFTKDLGDEMNDVLVLTLSDFGRPVAENGRFSQDICKPATPTE